MHIKQIIENSLPSGGANNIAELERAAGLANGTIGKWGKGICNPTAQNLKKVADFLGVTTDYLLGKDTTGTVAPATKPQLKLALFGTTDVDDETYDEAVRIAQAAAQIREQKKRDKRK